MNDKLNYELKNNLAIIHFPEHYWTGTWGEMLELVRNKTLLGTEYIIIDLSDVNSIGDCGMEFYILKKEFQEAGGKDVLIAGMPDFFQKLYNFLEEPDLAKRIKKYKNVEDAINSINL